MLLILLVRLLVAVREETDNHKKMNMGESGINISIHPSIHGMIFSRRTLQAKALVAWDTTSSSSRVSQGSKGGTVSNHIC